ncbi:MAG: TAXI family TRAP transporter solute-binding subunit [Rhizobacter sp.]
MPKVLRNTLLSARDLLVTAGPVIVIALLLLVLAYFALDPTPPKKVVLATGPDQGDYAEFGKRYQAVLKQRGIQVELRNTAGAAENLRLLLDPASGVDIAFLQGGAGERARNQADADALVSLGSLFYEPVWLFYRQDSAKERLKADTLSSLTQLAGWKVNVGARGSGSTGLMRKLLDANHVEAASMTQLRLEPTPSVVALLGGEIDALVFVSAPESLLVQMLLETPGIKLFDFTQAEAYSRRFPFMSPATLPRGVVDLAQDMPPGDMHLLAPTAALAAKRHTHPALVQLFVQAAAAIHSEAGWFQRKGEFPSAKNTEWPLSKEAERFYRSGPPLLQQYLPFWLANLIDRMWVALVSIIAILIPMSRVIPPLYEFRIRSRIFRWYGQLRAVEDAQGERPADQLVRDLDAIEQKVGNVTVPLSYADELYALRSHINLVRRRLMEETTA